MYLKFKLIALSIIIVNLTFAQLTTSNSQSANQLVNDVLAGDGVEISNVSFTGFSQAIGSFDGSNTNVGINSGVLLTTGTVNNTTGSGIFGERQGPHGPNDSSTAGLVNGVDGYQPLTDLANEDTYDAAILEFDFIPQSDTIRFKYVFGSEEYLENVDTEFNDIFAFFLSGPGYPSPINIATIPNTTNTPVSINNVNDNLNSQYYINNGTGSDSPQNSSDYYIQYDGFTTVLEAIANVECGETYHLVIAIADAGDATWDSGIFIEANSLQSIPPIEVTTSSTLNLDNDRIAEGCETATVTINRSFSVSTDALTIPISVSGTATQGTDFTNIPASITFAPGQTQIQFTFDILADNLTEIDESINLEFNVADPCGNNEFLTVNYIIFDVEPILITIPEQIVHCAGDEAILTPIVTGGVSIYTYNWNTGVSTESLTENPTNTTIYTLFVTDFCISNPVSAEGTITVPIYSPIQLQVTNDTTVLCPNTPILLASEAIGGESSFTYEWNNNNSTIGSLPTQIVSPLESTNYTITVTDGCGESVEKIIQFNVETSLLQINMSSDQLICPKDSANIWVEASGGLGDFTYFWNQINETSPNLTVYPNHNTTYTVSVEDGCHSYHIDGQTTITISRPHASFNVLSQESMEGQPVSFQNTSNASIAWEWDFGNDDYSSIHSPITTYDQSGWIDVQLIAINEIGCRDTTNRTIYIKPEFYFFAPNAFTPDGNSLNNTYKVSVIGAKKLDFMIYNRWGDLIYQTTDIYFEWDGRYKGSLAADGTYVYRTKVTDQEGFVHEHFGTITLLR